MQENSRLKEMIALCKSRLTVGLILGPIVIMFPVITACQCLKYKAYWASLLCFLFAMLLSLLFYFLIKSSKKNIAEMEKELEELKTVKEKIEKQ